MFKSIKKSGGTPALSFEELKPHIRVDENTDQSLAEDYIVAAQQWLEDRLNTLIGGGTYTGRMDAFPASGAVIELPTAPIDPDTEVTIAYTDTNGDAQTLNQDTDFYFDPYSEPGRLVPVADEWPETFDKPNAVTITWAGANDIKPEVLQSIRMLSAFWYDQRTPIFTNDVRKMNVPWSIENTILNNRTES